MSEKVMRASSIGFPCDRYLWYSVAQATKNYSNKTQRIFDVGTALEGLTVEWLKKSGWDVDYNPGSQEAGIEYRIPVKGGVIAGHPDCFISKGEKKNTIADIKTMKDASFKHWKINGALESKPQYVDQLHVYAMGAIQDGKQIDHLAIVGINKNDEDIFVEFFDYDPARAEELKRRTERIFAMEEAPLPNEPKEKETWRCGYCGFKNICPYSFDNKQRQADKSLGTGIIETDDPEIIEALRQYHEAKEQMSLAHKLKEDAENKLDELVRQRGNQCVYAGGLILTIIERPMARFDTAAFKEDHPEMVSDYTKTTSSLIYKVKEIA